MMNTWMLREERWNFKSEILNEVQGHVVLHWCREKTPPEINKKCNFVKASWVWGRTPSTCKPRIYPHLSPCLCWSWGWRRSAEAASPDRGLRRKASDSNRAQPLSRVRLFAAPWTVAHQAPLCFGFPGKNTGVTCHFLLQGIFLTQGFNLC